MLPKLLLLAATSTDVLKERLVFSKRYIHEFLPPEAKKLSMVRDQQQKENLRNTVPQNQ